MVCLPAIRRNARNGRVPGQSEVAEVLHLAVPSGIIVVADKILKQASGGGAAVKLFGFLHVLTATKRKLTCTPPPTQRRRIEMNCNAVFHYV
ncbi:hypothetical protein B296_00046234 [Ensete ventricosum]|uniref:Uncharacterized protein n=1 Tax=Ensete ventricosum TaxID=4639 RepID=A0A426Z4Q8_ENSVE|nr:hypothetical protein B296_00046234 [Ensete ventricosum]